MYFIRFKRINFWCFSLLSPYPPLTLEFFSSFRFYYIYFNLPPTLAGLMWHIKNSRNLPNNGTWSRLWRVSDEKDEIESISIIPLSKNVSLSAPRVRIGGGGGQYLGSTCQTPRLPLAWLPNRSWRPFTYCCLILLSKCLCLCVQHNLNESWYFPVSSSQEIEGAQCMPALLWIHWSKFPVQFSQILSLFVLLKFCRFKF